MKKDKKILKTILKVGKKLGVGLSEQEKALLRKKEMRRIKHSVERAEAIEKLERTNAKIRKSRSQSRQKITNQAEANINKILKNLPE
jgi:hypothetical protein